MAIQEEPCRVLFLCTGNSARSIMAEALLNHLGHGQFAAYSAGSQPNGQVHPLSIKTLKAHDVPVWDFRSKSWDEFGASDAPRMDYVITVCDSAAGEVCPLWPGGPQKLHWSFPDPAAAQGREADQLQVFAQVFSQIRAQIQEFLSTAARTSARMP